MANEPITREEILLNAVATGEQAKIEPITREEMFLAKLGGADVNTPTPITRKEQFLMKAMESMSGGSGGAAFATGTYTLAEEMTAQDVVIRHDLGVIPKKFMWFVTDPVNTSGLYVPGNQAIGCLYIDEEKAALAMSLVSGSKDMNFFVKSGNTLFSRLFPTEQTIKACDAGRVSGGRLPAGVTITWFVFGG